MIVPAISPITAMYTQPGKRLSRKRTSPISAAPDKSAPSPAQKSSAMLSDESAFIIGAYQPSRISMNDVDTPGSIEPAASIAPEIAACMGPTLAAAPPPPSRSIKSSSRLSAKPITAMLQYRRLISPHARFVSRMSEGIEPATRPQKRNISGVS